MDIAYNLRLNVCRKEVVSSIYTLYKDTGGMKQLYNFFGLQQIDRDKDYSGIGKIIEDKTIDELFETVDKLAECHDWKNSKELFLLGRIAEKLENLKTVVSIANDKNSIKNIEKEIAVIKDNVQNTADVVNLFTDIDKNRTSLEEQNKEINNRLDNLENKMHRLETSIELLVNLLQKS